MNICIQEYRLELGWFIHTIRFGTKLTKTNFG